MWSPSCPATWRRSATSLRAGDVIIAGSLVTALPAAAGERFELQVDGLGSVAVELDGSA